MMVYRWQGQDGPPRHTCLSWRTPPRCTPTHLNTHPGPARCPPRCHLQSAEPSSLWQVLAAGMKLHPDTQSASPAFRCAIAQKPHHSDHKEAATGWQPHYGSAEMMKHDINAAQNLQKQLKVLTTFSRYSQVRVYPHVVSDDVTEVSSAVVTRGSTRTWNQHWETHWLNVITHWCFIQTTFHPVLHPHSTTEI